MSLTGALHSLKLTWKLPQLASVNGTKSSISGPGSFHGKVWGRVCKKLLLVYGSELNHQTTAGFGPCVHFPGFHLGVTLFLTHSHVLHLEDGAIQAVCISPWTRCSRKSLRRQLVSRSLQHCESWLKTPRRGVFHAQAEDLPGH